MSGWKRRDPARIDEIVDLLRDAWKKNPDLRLCQLISVCAHGTLDEQQRARLRAQNEPNGRGCGFDPFFVEDTAITAIKPEIEKLAKEPD